MSMNQYLIFALLFRLSMTLLFQRLHGNVRGERVLRDCTVEDAAHLQAQIKYGI